MQYNVNILLQKRKKSRNTEYKSTQIHELTDIDSVDF